MIDINRVLEYNRELKDGLAEMFNMLPPGQQKKVLKNDNVRACLIRFGIIAPEE